MTNIISNRLSNLVSSLNERTLYALIALGFVLGIVGILELSDHTAVLKTERNSLETRLAQYGDGLDLDLWTTRAQSSKTVSDEWDNLYWNGQTPGLIAAQVQTRLSIIGAGGLLESLRIDVPPDVITLPDGNQVLRFQLDGRSSDAIDLTNTIGAITGNIPALSINEINLSVQDNNRGIVSLSGFAYFTTTIPDPAITSPAATSPAASSTAGTSPALGSEAGQ